MTNYELIARTAGWRPALDYFPTVVNPATVLRKLREGEAYSTETDIQKRSTARVAGGEWLELPFGLVYRKADNWRHACELDGLVP